MRVMSFIVLSVALVAPMMTHADCKLVQIAEFHTEPGITLPIVNGTINGKSVQVLIDTAASGSVIPLNEAQQLGLKMWEQRGVRMYDDIAGDSQVYVTRVHLKIGELEKSDLSLLVAGDAHSTAGYSLVLGDDVLSKVDVEFDLPHNAIRLFKPRDCTPPQLIYWGAAYSQASFVSFDRDYPDIESEGLLNGKKVRITLDTGRLSSLVDTSTAEAVGVQWASEPAAGPRLGGIGPKSAESRVGVFDSFALGDERVNNVKLLVTPLDYYEWYRPTLWLGADFFRAHRVYIDMKDQLILFSYIGGAIFGLDAQPPR